MDIYNDDLKKILKESKNLAYINKNKYCELSHLINAALTLDLPIKTLLLSHNINLIALKENTTLTFVEPIFNTEFKTIIEKTLYHNKENNNPQISIEDILLTILKDKTSQVYKKLKITNINKLITALEKTSSLVLISSLGTDLTDINLSNSFDKVIGRNNEINRIINILARKNKNNPVLVGDAGVGKTAIIEELARRIINNEVPSFMINKKIISINISSIIAGTKYRGEFEEKLGNIIKEVINNENIILFIDELHTIVGAGGAEGAIDASNILKPYLARSKFKLIGATTLKEYNKIIGKDDALDRRFQKVYINEPSEKETINIIKQIKKDYELFHNVTLSDKIIVSLVHLTNIYVHNKKNPDKSIDILDEICAKENILNYEKNQININKKITAIRKEINYNIKHNNIKKATLLKSSLIKYTNKLNKLLTNTSSPKVLLSTLKSVLEQKTNQKIIELDTKNSYIINIKKELLQKLYYQEEAINSLIRITSLQKYKNTTLPSSILLKGEEGTGKHLLVSAYANIRNINIIKLDANEFIDETTINKLLGSPQGYVGYDNENILSKINDYPNSIIVIDNFDQISTHLNNILNSIIHKGILTNNKQENIYFNNNMIFLISNTKSKKETIGFNETKNQKEKINIQYNYEITMNKLNKEEIINIIKIETKNLSSNYNIECTLNEKDYETIYHSINSNTYNCKYIKKEVQKYLENVLIKI
ncbi:MAG: AAA family ATPase [Bacilli bacterium]